MKATVRLAVAAVAMLALVQRLQPQEMRQVEYDIDGTTKYVNVTWNKPGGSTEQKQLKLPIHESFRMEVGAMAYVSAQKATVFGPPSLGLVKPEMLGDGAVGTVHVVIHVNWVKKGEASSDAPYGIAKASVRVE